MSVTLKEIAKKAGVSIRSVTRALKGEPGGNPETCKRVREIADKLGYVPNIAARNLRMRKSNIVGIVSFSTPISVAVRRQICLQRRLEEEGYYTISALIPDKPEHLCQILRNWMGMVDSVIFTTWNHDWNVNEVLKGLPMNYIFIDTLNGNDYTEYALVNIDRESGIKNAVGYLIDSGRKRIAYVGSLMNNRINGFYQAFEARHISPLDNAIISDIKMEHEQGYGHGGTIIDNRYDAVFFATDRMALGFYKYSYENKIEIPGDVAVIGFDDDEAGAYAYPILSTIAHPNELISEKVTELVKKENYKTGETVFPTKFIKRASV